MDKDTDIKYPVDGVVQKLKDQGINFRRIKGISGAGMQHGSVYWSADGEKALQNLQADKGLEAQLTTAFSHEFSPSWQDASTEEQCNKFDLCLGNEVDLAFVTGSKAHHVG